MDLTQSNTNGKSILKPRVTNATLDQEQPSVTFETVKCDPRSSAGVTDPRVDQNTTQSLITL